MPITTPVYGDIVDPAWAEDITDGVNSLTDGTANLVVATISTGSVTIPGRKYKTANETVNGSTSLQADDHLVAAVLASTTYQFHAFIMVTSGTTPDFKCDLSVPASSTYRITCTTWNRSLSMGSQAVREDSMIESESMAIPTAGTTFATQSQWLVMEGVVITSVTAGNATFRWAQNVSDPTNTVVYAGSWMELVPA